MKNLTEGRGKKMERTLWRITAKGKYLWLAPDFRNWLQVRGERAVDFFDRKTIEYPGLRFSPTTWINTPRKLVADLVEEMKQSGY